MIPLALVAFLCSLAQGLASDFPTTLNGFNPIAWWKLDESATSPAPNTTANSGTAGAIGTGYIVNDVTNAGSAVGGTYGDLVACGARPVAFGTLIALGTWSSSFAAGHDLALEAIERLGNNLWTPDECPLCAAAEPLEDRSTSP